jgi:hypothetical protein
VTQKSRQPSDRGKQRAAPEPEILSRRKTLGLEREGYRYEEWFEQPSGKRAAWLEVDIDDWTCAFRLAEQAGEMVVAEVRFFPKELEPEGTWIDHPKLGRVMVHQSIGEGLPRRRYGTWSCEPDSIPRGGVQARVLRQVKPGEALRLAFGASRGIPPPEEFESLAERRYKGKRRRRDELLLAHVALRYEQACHDQSVAPAKAVRERLRAEGLFYERSTVRDLIREARKQGFLTKWQRGALSVATDKTHALLKTHRPEEGGERARS